MLNERPPAALQIVRRALLVAFGVGSLFYAYFCVQMFRAGRFAASCTEMGIRRAAQLAPGNSDYWRGLGVVQLYQDSRPDLALASFHRAIEANPQDADAWVQAAYAIQFLGRAEEERNAIRQATAIAPARPEIRWRAANLLTQLDEPQALRENLRFIFAHDPTRVDAALRLAWKTMEDWRSVLELLPRNPEIYGSFTRLLAKSNRSSDALRVWQTMIHSTGRADEAAGFDLLDDFIAQQHFDLAQQVWISLLRQDPYLRPYAPLAPNLISNANFALPLLDRGFSWRRLDAQQLDIEQDASGGRPALRILWDAKTDAAVLEQIVPVQPNHWYEFSFSCRSTRFSGANGPVVVVSDLQSGGMRFCSSDLRNLPEWNSLDAQVHAMSNFLVVRVIRDAPTPLRGTLWLSDLVLKHEDVSGKTAANSAEIR